MKNKNKVLIVYRAFDTQESKINWLNALRQVILEGIPGINATNIDECVDECTLDNMPEKASETDYRFIVTQEEDRHTQAVLCRLKVAPYVLEYYQGKLALVHVEESNEGAYKVYRQLVK